MTPPRTRAMRVCGYMNTNGKYTKCTPPIAKMIKASGMVGGNDRRRKEQQTSQQPDTRPGFDSSEIQRC